MGDFEARTVAQETRVRSAEGVGRATGAGLVVLV